MGIRSVILFLFLFLPIIMIQNAAPAGPQQSPPEIGIVEKLGDFVPEGLHFQNEKGVKSQPTLCEAVTHYFVLDHIVRTIRHSAMAL